MDLNVYRRLRTEVSVTVQDVQKACAVQAAENS